MSDYLDCSLKPTLALKPEKRAKWLTQAISALKDGGVRVSDVYDIVGHPKFVNNVSNGVGQKMRRLLSSEMKLFTGKQRQGLEKSELFKKFPVDDGPKASKAAPAEVDEGKMDDMMARCRAFVRDNESLWEDRKRELDEAERQRREEEEERRQREEDEKRQKEEDARRAEEEARLREERRAEEAQRGGDDEGGRPEAGGSPERPERAGRGAEDTPERSGGKTKESRRSRDRGRSRDSRDSRSRSRGARRGERDGRRRR